MAQVETPLIPQQEATILENVSSEESASTTPNIPAEDEKDIVSTETTVKKENIPPKRLGVTGTVRRPASSSTSSSTKPATSSLSRAAIRPPRNSHSSATAPTSASTGHRSQSSIGCSGDEKKIPLPSSARRSSMAPTTTHPSPPKFGRASLASSTTRKYATSGSPQVHAVTRPVAGSTASKMGTTSSTTRSTLMPRSGTNRGTDPTKKLSAIAGSPASAPTASASTRPSTSSVSQDSSHEIGELKAKLDELQTKLSDSEARVEELQKEIQTSQDQEPNLQRNIEAEAKLVNEAQENIKATHDEMIKKLRADHEEGVAGLKARLAEVETAYKEAQESSSKAIEKAKSELAMKGATDVEEAVEKVKKEHAMVLDTINAELSSAKEMGAFSSEVIGDREAKIAYFKTQFEKEMENAKNHREEFKALQLQHEAKDEQSRALQLMLDSKSAEHQSALETLKTTLEDDHTAALAICKAAHADEIAKGNSDATSLFKAQVEELNKAHESKIAELQNELQNALLAHKSAQATHGEEISKLQAEVSTLKESAARNSEALKVSGQELESSRTLIATAEAALVAAQKEISEMKENDTAAESMVAEVKKQLSTLQVELNESKAELIKAQEQVAAFERTREISDEDAKGMVEQQAKVLAELSAALKSLEEKDTHLESIQKTHDERLKSITTDYEREIDALRGETGLKEELTKLSKEHESLDKQHSDAVSNHRAEVEKLTELHNTATAQIQAHHRAHEQVVEELKASHQKRLDDIHDKAVSAGHVAHAAELEQLQNSQNHILNAVRDEHSSALKSAMSEAENYKVEVESLKSQQKDLSATLQKAQDDFESLKVSLDLERTARAEALASLSAATSKESKNSELEALRHELQTLKDIHQASLMTAQQESAKATEEHLATKTTLEDAEKEIEAKNKVLEKKKIESEGDYKDMHDSMTQLVEEANSKAEEAEETVKQMKALLQVKEREIEEIKMKNKPAGLASSMYATENTVTEAKSPHIPEMPEMPMTPQGEQHDYASAALASLAKARLTVDHIGQMNEDMKIDNLNALNSITDDFKQLESKTPSTPPQ